MRHAPVTAAEASRIAEDALASGLADDAFARAHGRWLPPMRITGAGGTAAGWMVPVAFEDRLLGFAQLGVDGTFRRYAAFHQRPRDVENCPSVASWTDPPAIRERARAAAGADARLTDPVLTFEGSPDRIVWQVTAIDPAGRRLHVHVAGDRAWIAGSEDAHR